MPSLLREACYRDPARRSLLREACYAKPWLVLSLPKSRSPKRHIAAEESRSLAATNIGAAHALLRLLQEKHPASQVLAKRMGLRIDEVRHLAGEWAGKGPEEDPEHCT